MPDYTGYERAFKNAGISYTVEPGAYNRGHGDLNAVKFIVIHHTAGGNDAGDIRIVRDGRSDLPGPLSQLVLKRNGEPHLIAVGVCYHAPGSINFKGVAPGNGNWWSIGIEGVSNGYDDWTPAQRREYPRVVAALLKDMGLPSDAWIFHRDYQPGQKIDPGGFTKEWFASEVNKYYHGLDKPKETAIQAKRRLSPWLGNKTTATDELATPDGKGRYTYYENGAIYWTPETGACSLSSEMVAKYKEVDYETGFLKYPTGDVFVLPKEKGRAQRFQGGTIYWSKDHGSKIVHGRIGACYAEWNWEQGFLGMPKTDEYEVSDGVGRAQDFEGGKIVWSKTHDAHAIYGMILKTFDEGGVEKWGYPTGEENDAQDSKGRFQNYEFSTIYYKWGQPAAYGVKDEFLDIYKRMGFEVGRLGFPLTNEYEIQHGIYRQVFEGGSIEVSRITKAIALKIDGEDINI